MSSRQLIILAILTTLLLLAGLLVAISATSGPQRGDGATNPMRGRANMVDRLSMFDSAEEFADGDLDHVRIVSGMGDRIVLDDDRATTFPRYGYWTSPQITTEFGFTELIPSWNATTPPNTGVRFQVRVRDARSQQWSPWLYLGQWGRTIVNRRDDRVVKEFRRGVVHTDCLVLDRPADGYQVRACLQSFDFDPASRPSVRRISISYSGQIRDSARYAQLAERRSPESNWVRALAVPFRAQADAPPSAQKSNLLCRLDYDGDGLLGNRSSCGRERIGNLRCRA